MSINRAALAVATSAGVPVEEAGRMAGARSSAEAWAEFESLTGGNLALANRNLFGTVNLGPDQFAKCIKDGFSAKKWVQVSGGTKDIPAEFEEVDDHPTRLTFARFFAKLTGMDPGDKLDVNIKTTAISATVDLTEVVKSGEGRDILAALREHRGL